MTKFIHFDLDEFSCPHCGKNKIETSFVKDLDQAREDAGIPFKINSGYRCPVHNMKIGGTENSAHVYGVASDIECLTSRYRFKILNSLIFVGFTRIGIAEDFIHVDSDKNKDPEVVWLY